MRTRVAVMGAEESKRTLTEDKTVDTSAPVTGQQGRTIVDAAEYFKGPSGNQEKRCRVDALRFASCRKESSEGARPVVES